MKTTLESKFEFSDEQYDTVTVAIDDHENVDISVTYEGVQKSAISLPMQTLKNILQAALRHESALRGLNDCEDLDWSAVNDQ